MLTGVNDDVLDPVTLAGVSNRGELHELRPGSDNTQNLHVPRICQNSNKVM